MPAGNVHGRCSTDLIVDFEKLLAHWVEEKTFSTALDRIREQHAGMSLINILLVPRKFLWTKNFQLNLQN